MVSSFRVAELQALLGFANRNKLGKKGDLKQRALDLLKGNCNDSIKVKIAELHRYEFKGFDTLKDEPYMEMLYNHT